MLYPEQNEARLKLSLDGTWAFALGSCVEDQFDPAKPLPDAQPIAVPASYNDQNDQTTALRRHYGWAWYQRKVTLPTFCAGQRVVLRFGSVTHTANVWLNGQLIAQHKGGFTPFEADVTALLHPGETVLLTVACDNRVNHSTLPVGNEDGQLAFFGSDNAGIPSVEAAKRAAAPQNRPNFDFFNYAGIHRPVWLYTTPKEYIEDVTVVPAVDGTVQYAVKTTGSAPVHVMVLDADGNAVASAEGVESTLMYFVMDEYPRFLRRTGQRVFMVLAVWHGLFPFFKVQAGLAFAFGFVKDTLFDKHFFLWESCPRCVQVVRRFLGFSDICFKLRVG